MLTAKLEAKKENDKDRVYKVYIYIVLKKIIRSKCELLA